MVESCGLVSAFLLEKMSPHFPFRKTRHTQLQFRLELAKKLIGGFCGRKKMPLPCQTCLGTWSQSLRDESVPASTAPSKEGEIFMSNT